MSSTVYVVHCIDTEGPLHESIDATFERLGAIFGLALEPSRENLRKLQAGEIDLDGREAAVQRVVDPHLLAYNDSWDKVDLMLEDAMSERFRRQMTDSAGGGWIYNWFCVDHVDYRVNPRRRDIGFHNVFDHYGGLIRDNASPQDGIHFHYHPHPFGGEAHYCATHWWASSDSLHQVLSRRIIDRAWFPAANRAGFHVIRPDSHWFLEQHMPFDFSNQAARPAQNDDAQYGLTGGRYGDWRRAPANWQPYHPAADDYQVPGNCRRWSTRCLNVGTRYRLLDEDDVRQAFREAREGNPVVLAFTDHDFRDLRPDVGSVLALIAKVAADFPEVPFEFSEAIDAMRRSLGIVSQPPCDLDLAITDIGGGRHVMEVRSACPTFGPQPWLALRTVSGTYHFDNFDIERPFHHWRYVFDIETFPLASLSAVGVAVNNAYGTTTVSLLDPRTTKVERRYLNADTGTDGAKAASRGRF